MVHRTLFLGLGGNTGDQPAIFSETLRLIASGVGKIGKISPVYASPPWGFESNDYFWNMAVEVDTEWSPIQVLETINGIEERFGRVRKPGVYLSRQMDIDILLYDQLIIESSALTIPHPLMTIRRFVLEPLARIAPQVIHPLSGNTILELLAACPDTSEIREVYDGSLLITNR